MIENDVIEKAKLAERILRHIIVPGYDVDMVSSGMVVKLRLSRDGEVIGVYVDLSGSDPRCLFCSTLNEYLWRKVLERAEEELLKNGFKEVIFIDYGTNRIIDLHHGRYLLEQQAP